MSSAREYSKVHWSFWASNTVRGMSEDGRYLALYLLTCPHSNMLGVFRVPDAYVVDDLQWAGGNGFANGFERVSEAFRNVCSNGFATRDEGSGWVLIHRFLEWNPIDNPNQAKGALKAMNALPPRLRFIPELARDLEQASERFEEKLGPEFFRKLETLSKPFRNQEQEQEQEQEETSFDVSTPPDKKNTGTALSVIDGGCQPDPEQVVIELPTRKFEASGEVLPIKRFTITEWQRMFPEVAVQQELNNLLAYLQSNPDERKGVNLTASYVTQMLTDRQKANSQAQPNMGPGGTAGGPARGPSTRSTSIRDDLSDDSWATQ